MRKIDRTGETGINYQGCKMKIIKYNNAENSDIMFFDNKNIVHNVKYDHFQKGEVKNKFYPDVANIGYLGDVEVISKNGKHFNSYKVWRDMIYRCYNPLNQKRKASYRGCNVEKSWLCYSNFKKWYDKNFYVIPNNEPLNLDKDILFKNNKIYSKNTCLLLPKTINQLFIKTTNTIYSNEYAKYKYNKIKEKLQFYKNIIPDDIYDIILNYKLNIKGE